MHPKNLEVVEIIEEFIDKQGFNFIRVKSNSADYGVPQKRKRVFFIASKKSILSETYKNHGSNYEIEDNTKLLHYETV